MSRFHGCGYILNSWQHNNVVHEQIHKLNDIFPVATMWMSKVSHQEAMMANKRATLMMEIFFVPPFFRFQFTNLGRHASRAGGLACFEAGKWTKLWLNMLFHASSVSVPSHHTSNMDACNRHEVTTKAKVIAIIMIIIIINWAISASSCKDKCVHWREWFSIYTRRWRKSSWWSRSLHVRSYGRQLQCVRHFRLCRLPTICGRRMAH